MAVQRIVSHQLESVIECECVDGCKVCSLRTKIELPEVDIVDCNGVSSTIQALPVAPVGVQKVEICNATPDVENITYCNKDTDTQWLRREMTTFDNAGVPTTTVLSEIDLGVSCTDPQPDIEEVKLCINGTQQIQFYRFITSADQTTTTRELIDTVDTGIACNETRDVDVLTSCNGTTKVVEVKDSIATQVVFDEEQVLKVAIDKTCDVAPTSRDVDINTDCAGTTETVAVKDEFATEVVLKPNQNIEVTIDKSCDPIITSDIVTDCAGTTSTENVDSRVAIVGSENAIDVRIKEDCSALADRNVNVVDDCAGAVTSTAVNGKVAEEVIISGSTKPIEVRIKEDCTLDPIKTIATNIDCAGTTVSVDTTKTVEAVINQVVFTKQCPKLETVSEIEVCAANVTLVKKTTIDSEGTETIVFYGDNGTAVATPAAYTIGACAVPLTQDVLTQDDCAGATSLTTVNSTVAIAGSMKTLNVRIVEDCVPNFDTEIVSGCSSVDGRIILRKIVKNEETGAETITLVEQDGVTVVTDGSSLVACSGSDYETTEVCKKDALDNYYKLVTFVNSGDTTDTFQIWLDVDGNVVPPVVGATDCEFSCESNMEFERCFDTGAGVVTAQGYYTLSATNIETYTSAKVIGSTDPLYVVGANILAQIPTWNQVTCQAPTVIVDRTTTHARTSGANTYSAPFRSFSITAVSNDVTLNGQLMMRGFTVTLDTPESEQHITAQVVTGTDYFVTYVI